MRKSILKIYIWLALIAVAYGLWCGLTGLKIPCYYLTVMGHECPGCGLSRMIFSILTFRFIKAFFFNPVGFVAFFIWNGAAVLCWWGKAEFAKKPVFIYSLLTLTVVAFLIQGLLRNLL